MRVEESHRTFSGFSNTLYGKCDYFRPEKLSHIKSIIDHCAEHDKNLIARGSGYSYGDAAFCHNGMVLDLSRLNRFHQADWECGEIVVESGLTFRDLIQIAGPKGWLPPVTPGMSEITVGGALSMDIHGKNHRQVGGFSRCVQGIDLRMSDGKLIYCSRNEYAEIFYATIGGIGKTGIIERLKIQLTKSQGSQVINTITPTDGLDQAIETLEDNADAESTVFWGDMLNAVSHDQIRGAVIASHTSEQHRQISSEDWRKVKHLPLQLLAPFYNRLTNRAFNVVYGSHLRSQSRPVVKSLRSHLFPWDTLQSWNKLYGRHGFYEYQFVVSKEKIDSIRVILKLVIEKKAPSYFFAMKMMQQGEGILSYGMQDGISVLLDFPASNRIRDILGEVDQIVAAAGGRIHLAKDSRITSDAFHTIYREPLDQFQTILKRVDPMGIFSSAMSQRLGMDVNG